MQPCFLLTRLPINPLGIAVLHQSRLTAAFDGWNIIPTILGATLEIPTERSTQSEGSLSTLQTSTTRETREGVCQVKCGGYWT